MIIHVAKLVYSQVLLGEVLNGRSNGRISMPSRLSCLHQQQIVALLRMTRISVFLCLFLEPGVRG